MVHEWVGGDSLMEMIEELHRIGKHRDRSGKESLRVPEGCEGKTCLVKLEAFPVNLGDAYPVLVTEGNNEAERALPVQRLKMETQWVPTPQYGAAAGANRICTFSNSRSDPSLFVLMAIYIDFLHVTVLSCCDDWICLVMVGPWGLSVWALGHVGYGGSAPPPIPEKPLRSREQSRKPHGSRGQWRKPHGSRVCKTDDLGSASIRDAFEMSSRARPKDLCPPFQAFGSSW